ncbi:MAG: hypothetical protein EP349_00665, partial [Alphaproteobacteria bacterium]
MQRVPNHPGTTSPYCCYPYPLAVRLSLFLRLWFSSAQLSSAQLSSAQLSSAQLSSAQLSSAQLS